MTTRVYSYGAKPPSGEWAGDVSDALDLAWRYRNDLVRVELDSRDAYHCVCGEAEPELDDLRQQAEHLTDEIRGLEDLQREHNRRSRAKDPLPEIRSEIRDLRAARREAWSAYRELEREVAKRDEVDALLDDVDAAANERVKRLRAECGLHWGTYGAIEADLKKTIRKGPPPRFARRSEWDGKLAVQIQHQQVRRERYDGPGEYGTWAHLAGPGHGEAWLEPVEPDPTDYPSCGCGGRTHARCETDPIVFRPGTDPSPDDEEARAEHAGRRSRRPLWRLHLRIGGEKRNRSDWRYVPVEFALHRPVPDEALIKWIYLVRERRGTDEEWHVQFVLAADDEVWAPGDTAEAAGACGIDLGWRQLEDGSVRVAYVVGDDGHENELLIPPEQYGRVQQADRLRSIRDREFNAARDLLVECLGAHEPPPEWLAEKTETLSRWRSQARLAALVIGWRTARFDGDDEIFALIEEWRRQDKHLYDWEAAERKGFVRWRRQYYRRFAARLRWRYETVYVEDATWSDLMRRPLAEDDHEHSWQDLGGRWWARLAAPGRLREILRHGHPDVREVPSEYTTRECSICGAEPTDGWDAATELQYWCAAGHRMDQDRNAARNILARHSSGEMVAE